MARWLAETGQRIVVIFEGRDTAGKGGSIDMIAPRPQPAPVPHRRAAHRRASASASNGISSATFRICRRRARSPCSTAAGTTARASSRSWASAPRTRPTPSSTRSRTSSGTWSTTASCCSNIGCAATRSSRRSASQNRLEDPLKRWKLSPIDIQARTPLRRLYRGPRADAESHAHRFAPWTLVDFNDQSLGRLTLLRDLLDRLPDTELPSRDRLADARRGADEGELRGASPNRQLSGRIARLARRRRGIFQ